MPLKPALIAGLLCLTQAAHAETIRVGTPGDYAPVSKFNTETGRPEGTDIELVEQFAAAQGVDITYVATSWPRLMADLTAGKFDMAVGGISYTDDRAAQALVSLPLAITGKVALVRCGEEDRFDTLAEIALPGVRIVSNPGGTNERFAREHAGAADLAIAPDNLAPFGWLLARKADVMFTDSTEALFKQQEGQGLCAVAADRPYTRVEKVFLFRKDQADLQARFNGWFDAQARP